MRGLSNSPVSSSLCLALAALSLAACRGSTNDGPSTELVRSAHGAPPSEGGSDTAPGPVSLEPGEGGQIGEAYEAFLSPHQEPAEESDTPKGTPPMFQSTAPSKDRNARAAAGHRGHGKVRFSKDLSRAWVDVKIEGVKVEDINMFHIHCGQPGILGPILVDFSHATDITDNFNDDGVFSVEIGNAELDATTHSGHGPVAAFANGCVIQSPSLSGLKPSKVSTIAGMAHIAREGELYFNLHTTGQTYYGDIRGQLLPLEAE